jgi:molybdopterin adenylyltransferase
MTNPTTTPTTNDSAVNSSVANHNMQNETTQHGVNGGAQTDETVTIGLVSVSDRASSGTYQDQGIPALREWLASALSSPFRIETRLIPDERGEIEKTLIEMVDVVKCDLVITTGGTGPARRDVTPDATLAVATKEMQGFGEQMRQISLRFVPTAVLSRQTAVIRECDSHAALILNLPGQPKSIRETLEGLKDESGKQVVAGIFAAVPYCIDLIGGPYIETNDAVCKAFRPKSAIRTKNP